MKRTTEGALWLLGLAGGVALFGLCLRRGVPDEAQARREFLAEHPTFTIERVVPDEKEVIETSFRIFYRIPGDPTVRDEFRQYLRDAEGKWSITQREDLP